MSFELRCDRCGNPEGTKGEGVVQDYITRKNGDSQSSRSLCWFCQQAFDTWWDAGAAEGTPGHVRALVEGEVPKPTSARRECDNCKHSTTSPGQKPCYGCSDAGHRTHWEPQQATMDPQTTNETLPPLALPKQTCETCRHEQVKMDAAPCRACMLSAGRTGWQPCEALAAPVTVSTSAAKQEPVAWMVIDANGNARGVSTDSKYIDQLFYESEERRGGNTMEPLFRHPAPADGRDARIKELEAALTNILSDCYDYELELVSGGGAMGKILMVAKAILDAKGGAK